jgi:hypothetical protein
MRQADIEVWPVGFPGIKRITFEFRARTSAAQEWLEDEAGLKDRGVTVECIAATSLPRALLLVNRMRIDGLLVDVTRLVTMEVKTITKRHAHKKAS